jgi:phosphohistidine phosphatase
MKTLTLIRHAKSSWKYPGLDDADRPLSPRGRRDVSVMAKVLADRGFSPQIVISSPALRALRTAEVIAGAVGYPLSRIVIDSRWYLTSAEDLLFALRSCDPSLRWVACVGHNPEFTDLVEGLSPQPVANVPTCGVVEMEFDINTWKGIGKKKASRMDFDFPKNHRTSDSDAKHS